MKQIRIFAVLLAMLLLLTGCQLAQPEGETAQGQDRLIGVFITTEYLDLFDFDAYVQDNAGKIVNGAVLDQADTQPYEGRIYATLTPRTLYREDGSTTETKEYVFEGLEGISYFAATIPATDTEASYVTSGSDEAISDGMMNLSYRDDGDEISLEGTVYVAASPAPAAYYFNPVYQTAGGQVYLLPGNGTSAQLDAAGGKFGQTLNQETTVTENGETKTQRTTVQVFIAAMDPPEAFTLLQMDGENRILSQADYTPETLPSSLTLPPEAAYLIVETRSGESVTRTLLDRGAESLETFRCREDGICVQVCTWLTWY